ncbi:hypothetical protein, partial [Chitinilyticum litopenaei]|uniref:hypothetical protein n=1 Tax=Chitinilyticum litopenaei TaxID=1121276 RepID=UPI001B7FE968
PTRRAEVARVSGAGRSTDTPGGSGKRAGRWRCPNAYMLQNGGQYPAQICAESVSFTGKIAALWAGKGRPAAPFFCCPLHHAKE